MGDELRQRSHREGWEMRPDKGAIQRYGRWVQTKEPYRGMGDGFRQRSHREGWEMRPDKGAIERDGRWVQTKEP